MHLMFELHYRYDGSLDRRSGSLNRRNGSPNRLDPPAVEIAISRCFDYQESIEISVECAKESPQAMYR